MMLWQTVPEVGGAGETGKVLSSSTCFRCASSLQLNRVTESVLNITKITQQMLKLEAHRSPYAMIKADGNCRPWWWCGGMQSCCRESTTGNVQRVPCLHVTSDNDWRLKPGFCDIEGTGCRTTDGSCNSTWQTPNINHKQNSRDTSHM